MSDATIKITAQDNASKVLSDVRASMVRAQESAQTLGNAMGLISGGLALVGVAGIGGLISLTKGAIDGIDAFNDLKDATGASIENISALDDIAARTGTSFETVQTALVKFNGVLKDAKPGSEAEQAMRALGLSIKDLSNLDPAEALLKTSQALAGFADDGNKARLEQILLGKSIKEIAPFLKDLAERGQLVAKITTEQAEAAEQFNKELFNMQKNSTDAARALTIDLVMGINKAAKAFRESGLIEGFRTLVTGDDQHKNNVALVKQTDELMALERSIGELRNGGTALEAAQLRKKEERLKVLREEIKLTMNYRKVLEDGVTGSGPDKPSLPSGNNKANKGKPDTSFADEIRNQQKLMAVLSGVSADYFEQLTRLQAIRSSGNISEERYVELVTVLIDKQQSSREAAEAQAKTIADVAKIYDDASKKAEQFFSSLQKEQSAIEDSNAKMVEHIQEIGLTADALNSLRLHRLDDAIAMQEQSAAQLNLQNSSEDEIALAQRKIDLLKEQRNLTASAQVAQAGADTKADQEKAAQEFADTLHNDLKGAFSTAFRDTSGQPLQAFGDAIANVIYSRAATAMAESLAQSLLGSIGGASGGSGAGSILSSLFSFDGGGSTGSGARAGGLDGKGGFMAMLHPQETVLDHTKGQSAQPAVTVNYNMTVGDIASVSMVRQAVAGSERRIAASIGRSMGYGGPLS